MRNILFVLGLAACGGGDDAPSCAQAFNGYYDAGCTFIDQTNQPVPRNTLIAECQGELRDIPAACDDEFEAFLSCLEGSSPAGNGCDCTSESDAYLSCL